MCDRKGAGGKTYDAHYQRCIEKDNEKVKSMAIDYLKLTVEMSEKMKKLDTQLFEYMKTRKI